jgi:proline iminopeptidase
MNRRNFLAAGTAAALVGVTRPVTAANTSVSDKAVDVAPAPDDAVRAADALNPAGIRTAGIRMIPVVNGKYKVWTKRFGPSSGNASVKVLLLHGGPGFSHEYLEALESFLPQAGIEMYYYDQLGCNNSDQPDDPSLWTLARYTEEVEEVRRGLGLDNFVLFGHSWGGILAIEYALHYQQHLRGLVISNMTAGTKAYLKRTAALKQMLGPESLAKLKRRKTMTIPSTQRS